MEIEIDELFVGGVYQSIQVWDAIEMTLFEVERGIEMYHYYYYQLLIKQIDKYY